MSGINQLFFHAGTMPDGALAFTQSGHFVVPDGVTSISVLCIGGGGAGRGGLSDDFAGGPGGGAGALAYSNRIAVTPGETLTVTVGAGGPTCPIDTMATDGGDSSLARGGTTLVLAKGGSASVGSLGESPPGGRADFCIGDVAYTGGNGGQGQGGGGGGGAGGAAGYAGHGGNGQVSTGTSDAYPPDLNSGGGFGGLAGGWSSGGGDGGGGVGSEGIGADGAVNSEGGSDGGDGAVGAGQSGGGGGLFGGGGGGGSSDAESAGTGGAGAAGVVQIIWGAEFVWPSPPTPFPIVPHSQLGLTNPLMTLTGDGGAQWNVQTVDVSAFAGCTVRLVFRVEVGTTGTVWQNDVQLDEVSVDGNAWNFAITSGWDTSEAAVGRAYDAVPSWLGIQGANTDGYWCQAAGSTPSSSTGNLTPVTGGDLLYTETSSPVENGDVFWLRGPSIVLGATPGDLTFREARDITGAATTLSLYLDVEALPT